MPNENAINRIENLLNEVVSLGGKNETTSMIPNLTVIDAAPTGLTGYVIIEDNRDGDYIPALKVPGVAYANNDLVNVLFIEGTEPIAYQQASGSSGSPFNISKLVSPDETIDPVLSADNSGDVTIDEDNDYFVGTDPVAIVADGITKTVQAAGGDFTTIAGALGWFQDKLTVGSCVIDIEAGTYTETLLLDDLFIGALGNLEVQGDTRELVGLAYIDGCVANPKSLTNGGSGTAALSNAGTTLTVTGTGSNPDFDADGIANGDIIYTLDNAGTVASFTVSSVANNVITLTGTAPTIGNDGTAMVIRPNVVITRASAGKTVTVDLIKGIKFKGIFFENTGTGTDCIGLSVQNGGNAEIENCLAQAEDYGFYSNLGNASITGSGGAVCAFDSDRGFFANQTGQIFCEAAQAFSCTTYGFLCQASASMNVQDGHAVNCANGYYAQTGGSLFTSNCFARQNTTGYTSVSHAFTFAFNTVAGNNGNGTDYNPAGAGWVQGASFGVIFIS